MCGIAGLLAFSGNAVDRRCIENMTNSLAHRGPDDRGIYVDGPVGLGHRRLSIIDVADGRQPMTNEDGSLWITFNGEIFNFVELRNVLRANGHRFRTQSDTEVILALYEEHGTGCVRHLNGEWAFALWDGNRQRLFVSRDRLGVRPLFYTVNGNRFAFASEVKALFQEPGIQRAIDLEALDQLLTFWTPLPSRTLFANVAELRPGHSLVVSADGVRQERYWSLPIGAADDRGSLSEAECADRLLELLVDATRIRLRADVPVGAYVSGGLDSTVIARIACKFFPAGLRTFSATFPDAAFDESGYQSQVSRELAAEHQACVCTDSDIARVFPDVIWHSEKPVLRSAPAAMFLLSRSVRAAGLKVVVTGEGADETLGGYDIFKEAKIRHFWSIFHESTRRPHLLRRLYPYMDGLQRQPTAYVRAFFRVAPEDRRNPFFAHLPRWELTSRVKRFYSAEVRDRLRAYDSIAELRAQLPADYRRADYFSKAQHLETAHLLPGYILSSQGDRMGMAHGVEGRSPFLDHRVVEFAATVPPRLKMKVLNEKYILKRAARGLVPPVIAARKKQPFRAPEARCFFEQGRSRAAYVDEMLSPRRVAEDGLFDPAAVGHLVSKVRSGRELGAKDNMSFMAVLSTQLLIHHFIRSAPDAHPGN
jgi:asparagine synthase (glutamine-hydrolysing)